MLNLKEYIKESVSDDEDVVINKYKNRTEFCSDYSTLLDCLNGYVVSSFYKSLGPTRYTGIPEASKIIKKKYKAAPVFDRNGKKVNPSILSDIIASIASQVKIDWNLDPVKRLKKAIEDFNKLSEEIYDKDLTSVEFEKVWWGGVKTKSYFGVSANDEGDFYKKYTKNGSKIFVSKSDRVGTITIGYGDIKYVLNDNGDWDQEWNGLPSGELSLSILNSCPIMSDLSNFE